ncbi:MAG: hypothetical protein MJ252_11745 [archaeon]|nr:hypothetical protein [archaeon]
MSKHYLYGKEEPYKDPNDDIKKKEVGGSIGSKGSKGSGGSGGKSKVPASGRVGGMPGSIAGIRGNQKGNKGSNIPGNVNAKVNHGQNIGGMQNQMGMGMGMQPAGKVINSNPKNYHGSMKINKPNQPNQMGYYNQGMGGNSNPLVNAGAGAVGLFQMNIPGNGKGYKGSMIHKKDNKIPNPYGMEIEKEDDKEHPYNPSKYSKPVQQIPQGLPMYQQDDYIFKHPQESIMMGRLGAPIIKEQDLVDDDDGFYLLDKDPAPPSSEKKEFNPLSYYEPMDSQIENIIRNLKSNPQFYYSVLNECKLLFI